MVAKAKKEEKGERELLILKDTVIAGERVKRGQVVPYPKKHGSLLTGAANKAVVLSEAAIEAFELEEKRRESREGARGKGAASKSGGSPKKPD